MVDVESNICQVLNHGGDGAVDHTFPNKPHAEALRKLRYWLTLTNPSRAMTWWEGDYPCIGPWEGVSCGAREGFPSVGIRANDVTRLDLSKRSIGGYLDASIAEIDTLVHLDLANNFLAGQVPASLGSMPRLAVLNLHNNKLSGTIPPELGNSTSLRFIGLHSNLIAGTIPQELGRMTQLLSLDLASNRLEGSIPAELGNITALYELLVSKNKLTGPLPPELVGCVNLGWGLPDIARHVIGCHFTQETRMRNIR